MKRKIICLVLVAVLLIGVPVMASAAELDLYDYVSSFVVDGDNDLLTITLPDDLGYWRRLHNDNLGDVGHGSSFTYDTQMRYVDNDTIYYYIFGYQNYFPTAGIPVDAEITGKLRLQLSVTNFSQTYTVYDFVYLCTYDENGNQLSRTAIYDSVGITPTLNEGYTDSMPISVPGTSLEGATYWSLEAVVDFVGVSDETDTTSVYCTFDTELGMQVPISSLYRLQQQTGETNKLLQAVETQLQENGQTLDDILKQQEANGDKLDDMNQNIETLPGAVGDEIQDIVDKEQQEAENEGNSSAGEIVDIIPDPSKDLIPSLQKLVAVMNYEGTSAVITMPAITIPAIDGMFPAMRILDQQEVDFGEWFLKMPEKIMIVIRAFFDICVVGYCGKEILGLIAAFAGGVQDISRETEE